MIPHVVLAGKKLNKEGPIDDVYLTEISKGNKLGWTRIMGRYIS
jgi:hypothetical protein